MRCGIICDIQSEITTKAVSDKHRIRHPGGSYEARIKRAPFSDGEPNNLLRLLVIFEANDIGAAKEIGTKYIYDIIDSLAYVLSAHCRLYRLLQLFDWSPGLTDRSILVFDDHDPIETPIGAFESAHSGSIEQLLAAKPSAALNGALRWFRLGAAARSIEEQFQNFWLAFELISEFRKPSNKVPSLCPKCRQPLYCEACSNHPTHRPYAKQAIELLIKEIAPATTDLFDVLNKARNTLMHGGKLEDIEDELPCTADRLIDILGALAREAIFKTLVTELPSEAKERHLATLQPSRYAKEIVRSTVHITGPIAVDQDGDPDMDKVLRTKVSIDWTE